MYIYLMKCSIFYKIGFSKNPKNRLKTVKTHNPLNVEILATLKTYNHLSLEKELHVLFLSKRTRGEWFELHEDDLITLKVGYGFNFKKSINNIKNSEVKNKHILNEIKEIRIDNNKLDYCIQYFEDCFECSIVNKSIMKKCCIKFKSAVIKKSIDSLYSQDMDSNKAYNLMIKVCSNFNEMEVNPAKYIAKIANAIYYKHYRYHIDSEYIEAIENRFNTSLDPNEVVKTLNSKKFYLSSNEFIDFIFNKYMI